MSLTYTTVDAIARRLQGRLGVHSIPSAINPHTLDDALIDQVGEQVEARVNAQLRSLYKLPLTRSHPTITSVVEKLIVCELAVSQGLGEEQLLISQAGSDRSYAGVMCKQGENELKLILSGQIVLDGETTAQGEEVSPTRNQNLTLASLRRPGAAERVEW